MTDAERALYGTILAAWGERSQIFMAVEECAELIHVLLHYARFNGDPTYRQAVLEELADALVMVEQLSVQFGWDDVQRIKRVKLERVNCLLALEAQEL